MEGTGYSDSFDDDVDDDDLELLKSVYLGNDGSLAGYLPAEIEMESYGYFEVDEEVETRYKDATSYIENDYDVQENYVNTENYVNSDKSEYINDSDEMFIFFFSFFFVLFFFSFTTLGAVLKRKLAKLKLLLSFWSKENFRESLIRN